VTIEKAFAIKASPETIWDALWADLAQGDQSRFRLEGSSRPNRLELAVDLSGVPCSLTYTLTRREVEGDTEVAANLAPLGWRYGLYYVLSFGHIRRNYEMLLVSGLANLKSHVEGSNSAG
jgi:hypothetical protein